MLLRGFLVTLSLFSGTAQARVLSWSESVNTVSENNPQLKSAHESVNSSEALVGSSRSGFFPSLSASVNASHGSDTNNTTVVDPTTGIAYPSVSYSSALTLNYNLFNGFKDAATVSRAKGNLSVSQASLDDTRASLSDSLRQGFIKLNYAQAYVKLTQAIVDRRAQNERLVRAQYESGRENQGSYLLSQSKLEQAKFDALVASHQLVAAQENFAHVLGEDPSGDLSISGTVPSEDPPAEPKLKDLVPLTPTHRTQEAQVEVSRANVQLSKSGYLPTLDFTSSILNRKHVLYTETGNEWTIGLSLSIPLFSGLSTYYDTKSSNALQRSAEYTQVATDFQTYDLLRQSLFTFQESVQKLKVDQTSLNAINVQEQIARKQYNNGLMSFENWDIIEGNLVTAQKTALASERDRAIAESSWRQAQGLGDLP